LQIVSVGFQRIIKHSLCCSRRENAMVTMASRWRTSRSVAVHVRPQRCSTGLLQKRAADCVGKVERASQRSSSLSGCWPTHRCSWWVQGILHNRHGKSMRPSCAHDHPKHCQYPPPKASLDAISVLPDLNAASVSPFGTLTLRGADTIQPGLWVKNASAMSNCRRATTAIECTKGFFETQHFTSWVAAFCPYAPARVVHPWRKDLL
jgi:hypothetical protein